MRLWLTIKIHISKLIPVAEHPSDSNDIETNKTSAISNFMPQMLTGDEISEGINSLNLKQRQMFNMVHTWGKDHVNNNGNNVQLIHIFTSGSGDTGETYLVKVIYNAVS